MFKSKAICSLLDATIKSPSSSTSSINQPQALALTILSSKNGSPLLSSITVEKPFSVSFDSSENGDPLYATFLDQFTSIDYQKIKAIKLQAQAEELGNDISQTTLEASQFNNIGNTTYGSISQQPTESSGFEYTKQNPDANGFNKDNDFNNNNININSNISNASFTSSTSTKLADVVSDAHSSLELLSHYVFTCYSAFKRDYLHYQELQTPKKPVATDIDSPDTSMAAGVGGKSKKKSGKHHKRDKDTELVRSLIENVTSEEKVNGLRWFNIQIDGKDVFLYLIFNSKTSEDYFLLYVCEKGYPKGLAKLKLEKLESLLKENGF
ncbi:hypothetical protein DASC09_032050 [Saccharomycopsis crataegensis]|uniref:Uncharacterized protein n=1 Tax=Saccharomycopsis crataegensis TaxID=43959 RepID=A0AAV5QMW7_9ASCO|nr:hypothetical protein DASC09_032050 [Saccharomycopsis crataegensis]